MNNTQEYIISLRDKFSATADKTIGKTQELDDRVNKLMGDIDHLGSGGVGSVFGGMALFEGLKSGFESVKGFFEGGLDASKKLHETEAAMGIVMRSQALAKDAVEQLDALNTKSLLPKETIMQAGQLLLSLGNSAAKTETIIKQLGDVSLGNASKFTSMFEVYARAQQRGYISARELNGFVEAGVPIYDALGKIVGKSGIELRKFMSEGTVNATQLEEALQNLTTGTGEFADAQQRMAQDSPWLQTQKDIAELQEQIANGLLPVYERAMKMFAGFLKWVEQHEKIVKAAAVATAALAGALATMWAFEKLAAVWKAITIAIETFTVATNVGTGAVEAFSLALDTTPLGLIITTLGAAAAAFGVFKLSADGAQASVDKVHKSLGDMYTDPDAQKARFYLEAARHATDRTSEDDNIASLNKILATRGLKMSRQQALYGWDANDVIDKFANGGDAKTKLKPDNTPDEIAGGGIRNLTINLGKFFDNIIFNGTTIDKDAQTVAGTVAGQLLRVLNSANKVQTGL